MAKSLLLSRQLRKWLTSREVEVAAESFPSRKSNHSVAVLKANALLLPSEELRKWPIRVSEGTS